MTSSLTNTASPAAPTMKPWKEEFELHGYHRMARMIGRSDNLAIFRRFNDLNMLSLLDMQAEIQGLRDQLYIQCEKDSRKELKYSSSMKQLRESEHTAGTEGAAQYHLLLKIRSRMTEYS
jgi:hypothetical protein